MNRVEKLFYIGLYNFIFCISYRFYLNINTVTKHVQELKRIIEKRGSEYKWKLIK